MAQWVWQGNRGKSGGPDVYTRIADETCQASVKRKVYMERGLLSTTKE